MKAYLKLSALSLTLLCGACQPNDGWQQLFNGKDFTGFKQLNGKAPYRVENGCMVGQTVDKEPNSFMATEQTYGDFILEFEVKCHPDLNSGVQFRSESKPDYNKIISAICSTYLVISIHSMLRRANCHLITCFSKYIKYLT